MSAREEVLRRIRSALGPASIVEPRYADIPRDYTRGGSLDATACLHLLKVCLLDYDAEVIEVDDASGIAGAIADALQRADEHRLLVAPEFADAWRPEGIEIVNDDALSIAAMDGIAAVATPCEAAVAATGTLLLVHEGAQGRRAITLLPDHHICVVARAQVFETVPEALAAIAAKGAKPITTVSGPSATSDIEMTRIRGVHGPRRLSVVLYGPVRQSL